ncbi:MAG: T9SS type A sorting domain-containing protein [Saprospiraceae bacterium]|nr:T9SS type A sorting domain-containing protein [Saprospiraceae bacterium]
MKYVVQILGTCLMSFCFSVATGQNLEFTWQPDPLAELDVVIPVKDGLLWAVGGKSGYSRAYLQKRTPNGEFIWETELPSQNGSFLSALVELPDFSIMAIFTLNFCDHWIGPSYMLFDADGQFLQYISIENTSYLTYKLTPFVQEADTFLLAWKKDFTSSPPYPYSLTRWNISTGTEYIYPIQTDGQDHPVVLKYDVTGNILIGLGSGGFGIFDPLTETVSDTLAADFGIVYDVAFQSDGSFFTCGKEKIALYNAQGIELQHLSLPQEIMSTGYTTNGNLIALATNQSTLENRIFILNSKLDTVSIMENLSNDAQLTQLLVVDDQPWALGQEHQNVFAKSFSSTGNLPTLNQDTELLEISFESSLDTITPWFTPNCNATFKLENVKAHILNKGNLPLHQVIINWDNYFQSSFSFGCEYSKQQILIEGMDLLPGQSEWISIPNIELYTYVECNTPVTVDHDFCMELTCPNQMIDADHTNDFSCTPVEFLISSQDNPRGSTMFTIYPNPFSDQISLQDIPNGASSMDLYDVYGRKVLQRKLDSNSLILDLPNLTAGLYTLILRNSQGHILSIQQLIQMDK